MALGKNITTIRESRGLSIEDIARKLSIPCGKIIDWEAGDEEPTIMELKNVSYILDVTMDELVKEREIVPVNERYYLTDEDYRDIANLISSSNRENHNYDLYEMGRFVDLGMLYSFMSKRFINAEGKVYDRFLISNTDRQEREKIVRRYFRICEEDTELKDYIDGKSEINDCIDKMRKELSRKFNEECKRINNVSKSNEAKNIYDLNCICDLADLEDYSEKKIKELNEEIQDYIKARTGNTLLDRALIFWSNEALETMELRDSDRIHELINAWKKIRSCLMMMVSASDE